MNWTSKIKLKIKMENVRYDPDRPVSYSFISSINAIQFVNCIYDS